MNQKEWLESICDPKDIRPITQAPHKIFIHGEPYAWSTSGNILLFLKGLFDYSFNDKDAKISDWAEPQSKAPFVTSLSGLRVFAGGMACSTCRETGRVDCDACEGKRGDDCDCPTCGTPHSIECDHCENGEIQCPNCANDPVREGYLCDIPINRALLGKLLRGAPGVEVKIHTAGIEQRVQIFGDGWIGLIMPMRYIDKSADRYPAESTNMAGDGVA